MGEDVKISDEMTEASSMASKGQSRGPSLQIPRQGRRTSLSCRGGSAWWLKVWMGAEGWWE